MRDDISTGKRAILTIIIFAVVGVLFVIWISVMYPIVENDYKVWMLFLIFYVFVGSLWLIFTLGIFGVSAETLKAGIVGWVVLAVMDIWIPTYAVNMDGSLISANAIGYKGTVDYAMGYYLHCFGLGGFIVWLLVYFIIPVVVLFTVMIVVKPDYFMKNMK